MTYNNETNKTWARNLQYHRPQNFLFHLANFKSSHLTKVHSWTSQWTYLFVLFNKNSSATKYKRVKGMFFFIKSIILLHCVSLFANSNSLNLFCLSESAVCDNFFWSQNEFWNEFWNWTLRLLSWAASLGPDSASQASTELHQGCCVLY